MGSYVPNTKEQRQEMLKEIGFQTIDDLFAHIPAEVKIQGGLNIPEGKTELEVRRDMENIAAKNQVFKTIFRGAGAYRHFIPATVKSVISKENLLKVLFRSSVCRNIVLLYKNGASSTENLVISCNCSKTSPCIKRLDTFKLLSLCLFSMSKVRARPSIVRLLT